MDMQPKRRVRRRVGSVILAGAIAATLLTACSSSSDPSSSGGTGTGPVTLSMWGWIPGLEDMVAKWNAKNPNIKVDVHRMTGDDGQKVEAAVDAGAGPDLVQLSTHELPNYVISKRVKPITQYVADIKANNTPSAWASVTFGNDVYGVPQGIGPAGLMYRTDLFQKFGIAVPKTWDDYLAAARKIHAADKNTYIANLSPTEIGQWSQEIQQAHSSWYGIKGDSWTVGVNDGPSKTVAQRWQTLLDEKLVTTQKMWTPEYWALVNSGKIATISYAAWFPTLLEQNAAKTSGKWRVAALPTNAGSGDSGDSGGAAVVVLKGSKNVAAAAKFASWLNDSDDTADTLITVSGLFPSTKNGLASPALLKPWPFFGGQVINQVFTAAAQATPATWTEGPNYGTAQKAITDEFSKVVTGQETFLQALDKAQATTVDDLKSRGLSVAS
jgi:multiple sugar transport system substrate-binding protein